MNNETLNIVLSNLDALDKIKKEAKELAIKDLFAQFKLSSNGIDFGVVNVFKIQELDFNYKICFLLKINGVEKSFEVKRGDFRLVGAKEEIFREMREQLMNMIFNEMIKDIQLKRIEIKI